MCHRGQRERVVADHLLASGQDIGRRSPGHLRHPRRRQEPSAEFCDFAVEALQMMSLAEELHRAELVGAHRARIGLRFFE